MWPGSFIEVNFYPSKKPRLDHAFLSYLIFISLSVYMLLMDLMRYRLWLNLILVSLFIYIYISVKYDLVVDNASGLSRYRDSIMKITEVPFALVSGLVTLYEQ